MTTTTGLRTFDHSLATTQDWLKDVQQELSLADQQQAFVVTRAVLHTLRDRLTVEEAAQFAAQLPMLLQGLYYHEWKPGDKPLRIRDKDEFLGIIAERLMGRHAPEEAARAVFRVTEKRMTGGEIEDVKSILPAEIREIWPES
jgi:uncharacterized protein (DUF2267 family)